MPHRRAAPPPVPSGTAMRFAAPLCWHSLPTRLRPHPLPLAALCPPLRHCVRQRPGAARRTR
eukprot:5349806-Prymnesium_polylepis.1